MNLVKTLFGGISKSKTDKQIPWIDLNTEEMLDTIVEASETKPQLIFKHSTRCGISRMVKNQFATTYSLTAAQADLYYLDLLQYRTISNQISERFKISHESPQLLVIKNTTVIASASHSDINNLEFSKWI